MKIKTIIKTITINTSAASDIKVACISEFDDGWADGVVVNVDGVVDGVIVVFWPPDGLVVATGKGRQVWG